MTRHEELWALVATIPKGKVASYSGVGMAMTERATGRMIGKWMAQSPYDIPWWRVVAKSGDLPTFKRDPSLGLDQTKLLKKDGVPMKNGRVAQSAFWDPEPLG